MGQDNDEYYVDLREAARRALDAEEAVPAAASPVPASGENDGNTLRAPTVRAPVRTWVENPSRRPPGWYLPPETPSIPCYWNGAFWDDTREPPATTVGGDLLFGLLAAALILIGAVWLWSSIIWPVIGGDSDSGLSTYTFSDCVNDTIDATFLLWLDGQLDGPWDEGGVRAGAEEGCADLR